MTEDEEFSWGDCCDAAEKLIELRASHAKMLTALKEIERWFGEFPETGQFWNNEDGTPSDRPMSYGACYGSNGERDFMRSVARAAIAEAEAQQP